MTALTPNAKKARGPDGYLSEKGLIPMPDDERKKIGDAFSGLKSIAMP